MKRRFVWALPIWAGVIATFLLPIATAPGLAQTPAAQPVSLPIPVAPAVDTHAVDPTAAAGFVSAMVDDFFGSLAGKTLSREQRARLLDGLLQRYLNVQEMSEDLLGRSWTRASDSEQVQFQQTLIAYMLAVWGRAVGDVSPGHKITVTGAESHGRFALVRSLISSPGDDGTPVAWLVGSAADGHLFVADVNVEGVSMIGVMKSDFTSVLFANAGRLGSLIAGMQKKIAAAN